MFHASRGRCRGRRVSLGARQILWAGLRPPAVVALGLDSCCATELEWVVCRTWPPGEWPSGPFVPRGLFCERARRARD
eukprot:13596656-Alexandrium_andersonii.AAC.1